MLLTFYFFFFKQKTAYEMRISDWSSDVCSSDLVALRNLRGAASQLPGTLPVAALLGLFALHGVLDRRLLHLPGRRAAGGGGADRDVARRSRCRDGLHHGRVRPRQLPRAALRPPPCAHHPDARRQARRLRRPGGGGGAAGSAGRTGGGTGCV